MTSEGHADSDNAYDHPGILLPYSRQRAGVSHASPRRDTRFTEALTAAPHLVLVPTFRSIGDSLFVLAFFEAFAAYRRLDDKLPAEVLLPASTRDLLSHLAVPPAVVVDWFDDEHLYRDGLAADPQGAVLVTDGRFHIPPGAESHRIDTTHAYPPRYIELDPTSQHPAIHSSLTARYALWFEELVGVVLPLDPPHAHPRLVFSTPPEATSRTSDDELHVAVIATASTPARDYGAAAHLYALASAVQDLSVTVTAHVILPLGAADTLSSVELPGRVRVVAHADLSLTRAGNLMAWCDLTIGHDTGMAELAAISYPSREAAHAPPDTTPPVVTVFGRYDHDMWSISPRIHPVPSAASASMTAHNRSHVLTADEWDAWGANAEASSVNSTQYTEAIREALARTGTTTQPTTSLTRAVTQLRRRTPPPPAAPPEDRIIEHATLSQLVTSLFDLNASNWTLEDQVREHYDDLQEVGRLKRLIDQHNRVRHRLIELIDDRTLPATSTNCTTPVALETPGMLTDRLVVLAIRLWHLSATPPDSSTGRQLRTAEQQWNTLIHGLERLTNDLANGTIRCDIYRALKNYGSQHTR